jgi:sugar lactone lactonase YvrE
LLLSLFTGVCSAQSLNNVTSWVGNTFSGTPNMLHVQLDIDGLFVSSDGQCYTTSSWDEGGRTDSIYQNGGLTTPPDFCGDLNGDQVATDGQDIYYAGWSGVNRYTMSGNFVDRFGTNIINGLALANGQIYLGETTNNLVQIYNLSTESLINGFTVAAPTRIAVDTNGGIWVAHYLSGTRMTGTLDCYNSSGTHLRSITLPNQGNAAALAIDNRGRLLVCDNGPDLNVKIYTNLTASRCRPRIGMFWERRPRSGATPISSPIRRRPTSRHVFISSGGSDSARPKSLGT